MAIESPVDVLRRLREQARTQRLARAAKAEERFQQAKTGKERSRAFGAQIGRGLYERFNQPDYEQDPAVLQAKARQKLLNVKPDDIEGIKRNIKVAAEMGDYEVSNYLTQRYYQAQQLALKAAEASAKASKPDKPDKLQSKLGKQQEDVRKLREQGRNAEANELESRILEQQAQAEATARKKQMETYDTALSNSFGVNLEEDISHESVGQQYQNLVESAYDINKDTGKDIGKIRNDMKKYFTYDAPSFWKSASYEGFRLSDKATDELKKNKIGFGYDDNTGRYGLYKTNSKGLPTSLISYVEERLVPEKLRK